MARNDKLDALIMLCGDELIKKNNEIFIGTDTSNVIRPKSLDRRVRRNINKENRKKEFGAFYKYGRRIAAAFLVAIALAFAAAMSVKAVRNALWNAIVEFFDDYLAISYVAQTEVPTSLEEIKEPIVNKEGWVRQVLGKSVSMYVVIYYENEKKVLKYTQGLIDENSHWFDNENTVVEDVKVGDNSGVLMFRVNEQAYSLSWSDGRYRYSLGSFSPEITREEMLAWAESVDTAYINEKQIPKTIEEIRDVKLSEYGWSTHITLQSPLIYSVNYYENETMMLSYVQNVLSENKTLIDNENSIVEEVSVGEYPAILVFRVNKQVYSLSWSDGEYEYGLDAHSPKITKDDLLAIAETVY